MVENGYSDGLWSQSITAYSSSIGVIVVTIVLDSSNWTLLTHAIYWFFTVIWYFPIFMFAWDRFDSPVQNNVLDFITTSYFWLIILVNIGIWGGLKYLIDTSQKLFWPSLVDIIKKEARKHAEEEKKKEHSDENLNILDKKPEADVEMKSFPLGKHLPPIKTRKEIGMKEVKEVKIQSKESSFKLKDHPYSKAKVNSDY